MTVPGETRVKAKHSLHDSEKPELCPNGHASWRTIVCGGEAGEDRDVQECSRCGRQVNVRCNFDEDYA